MISKILLDGIYYEDAELDDRVDDILREQSIMECLEFYQSTTEDGKKILQIGVDIDKARELQ